MNFLSKNFIKAIDKNNLFNQFFLLGTALVCWVVFMFVSGTFLQFLQLPITSVASISCNLFFFILFTLFIYKYRLLGGYKKIIIFWLCFLSIFIFCVSVSIFFIDYSYDGQGYQGEGILQIANGWNPVYKNLNTDIQHSIWIQHYPKATWISSAMLYKLTGYFEAAKAINLLLIFACFFIVLYTLRLFNFFSTKLSVFIAFFIAFDPVNLNMFLSFLVDGQCASMLTIFIALTMLVINKSPAKYMLPFTAVLLYVVNIKFTSLAYVVLFFIATLIYFLYNMQFLKRIKFVLIYSSVIALAVLFFGFSTYVKNMVQKQHPFYPLAGKQKLDLLKDYAPLNFAQQNRVVNFTQSIFAKTAFSDGFQKPIEYKIPFSISKKEVERYAFSGVMIGGFGTWFSAIFLLSLVFLVVGIYKRKSSVGLGNALFILGAIIVSVFINPACWWARYVPQFWLFPFICLYIYNNSVNKKKWLIVLFQGVIFINAAIVGGAYLGYNFIVSNKIKNQVKELQNKNTTPLLVNFGGHNAKRVFFDEHNLSYKIIPRDSLQTNSDTLFRSEVLIKK